MGRCRWEWDVSGGDPKEPCPFDIKASVGPYVKTNRIKKLPDTGPAVKTGRSPQEWRDWLVESHVGLFQKPPA